MIQELKHVDRSGFSLMPWLDEFERFAQKVSRQGGKIVTTAMCQVKPYEVQMLLTPIVELPQGAEPQKAEHFPETPEGETDWAREMRTKINQSLVGILKDPEIVAMHEELMKSAAQERELEPEGQIVLTPVADAVTENDNEPWVNADVDENEPW